MFQYDDLEGEIQTYLNSQSSLTSLAEVIVLPENQAGFRQPIEKGLIVIAYAGSDFDPPPTNDTTFQMENVSLLLNVSSSSLRDDRGIYNLVRIIKGLLQGFNSDYLTGRLTLKSIQIDDRNEREGIYSYNVEFAGRKLQIQELDDQENGYPLTLSNVTINTQI